MGRRVNHRLVAWLACVLLALAAFPALAWATTGACAGLEGSNVGHHVYQGYAQRWATPCYSYLTKTSDGGFMRVQGDVSGASGPVVSYYTSDFALVSRTELAAELPLFGGFYETSDAYYLVSGQNNPNQDDSLEVYRITKYNKSWQRQGSCGLYGANTVVPFDAGSCRMDSEGNMLIVRTCHKMYQSSDGYNHQSSVSILVNTSTMQVAHSYTGVMNTSYGYVSHSFNQFVRIVDGQVVAVDHGDAYPRGIGLLVFPSDVSSGRLPLGSVQLTTVMGFQGSTGNNATGATVGGFEASSSCYLVAGSSVPQDSSWSESASRNVFVSAVNKSSKAVSTTWLTSYTDGTTSASTPQLVKVSDERFLVLWTVGDQLYSALVDASGAKVGTVQHTAGSLSDCQPIMVNGKATWYTWKDGAETFWQLATDGSGQLSSTEANYAHDWQVQGVTSGLATMTCSKCGESKTAAVPTSFTPFWKKSTESGSYWSNFPSGLKEGDSVAYLISSIGYENTTAEQLGGFSFEVSNPKRCVVDQRSVTQGTITFKRGGTYTITVYPTYNPSLRKTFTVTISGEPQPTPVVTAPQATALTYVPGLTLGDVSLSGGSSDVPGTWAWKDASQQLSVPGGTYTCTFTPDNDEDYATVDCEVQVVVNKATPQLQGLVASGITYGQSLADATVQGTAQLAGSTATDVQGSFAWVDSSICPTPADSGLTSYSLYFVPSDTTNYESVEASLTIQVAKAAQPSIVPPAQMSVPYATATLSNDLLSNWPDWSFDAADLGTALSEGATTYTARYTAADADCYETTTQDIAITRSACDHAQTEVVGYQAPTCTDPGSTGETRCVACGEVIVPAMDIAPLNHKWYESERINSTCTLHGSVTYACENCGTTKTDVLPLDEDAHTGITEESGQAASFDEDGWTAYTWCKDCGTPLSERKVIPRATSFSIADQALIYTGAALEPAVYVWAGNTKLVAGEDYTVSYDCNVDASPYDEAAEAYNATCVIRINGIGDYDFDQWSCFAIEPRVAGGQDTTIETEPLTYDFGKVLHPQLTIRVDGRTLEEGVDYTLETWPEECIEPGSYDVYVTFQGNYTGSAWSSFEVKRVSQDVVASDDSLSLAVGKTDELLVWSWGDGELSYTSSNPKVVTVNESGIIRAIKPGTATITITASATNHYEEGVAKVVVKVNKAANSLSIKAKKAKPTVSFAKLKKAAQGLANVQVVKKGQGTTTFTNVSTNAAIKKWKVDKKTGKLTIPKGTKKGTYTVKIKAAAAGNASYEKGNKTIAFKVVVK